MEVKTITYQRVKNLGNYESERIEMTAEIYEDESPAEAAENLKEIVLEALDIDVNPEENEPPFA